MTSRNKLNELSEHSNFQIASKNMKIFIFTHPKSKIFFLNVQLEIVNSHFVSN